MARASNCFELFLYKTLIIFVLNTINGYVQNDPEHFPATVGTSVNLDVHGPAAIVAPPRNVTKLEGYKTKFICEAKALPTNVTHRWFHNGVEISQLSRLETRTVVHRDGTLFISNTSAEDSGKYTCEVTNGIGTPDTASAFLSVEYPARITYSPTIQYLPLGLSGVIKCYIQANPPLEFITWSKNRRPFDPRSTPGVVTLNNGSLLFQRVSHEHEGRYICTPYNIHGTAQASNVMEVLVRDPPMYTLKPKEIYQKPVDSEIELPCEGHGEPKPAITWRRVDGSELPRERAVIRGGNLTIRGLKKEDHGRYECVLENEIATLVTSTLLLVENVTTDCTTNHNNETNQHGENLKDNLPQECINLTEQTSDNPIPSPDALNNLRKETRTVKGQSQETRAEDFMSATKDSRNFFYENEERRAAEKHEWERKMFLFKEEEHALEMEKYKMAEQRACEKHALEIKTLEANLNLSKNNK